MARRLPVIFMAMAAGFLPSPAHAAIVVATFTGVISDGNDGTGYFTPGGGDLTTVQGGAGTPFISGSFSYDTDALSPILPGFYANDGFTPDWLGFSVTIAGTSYTFGLTDGSGFNSQGIFVADDPDDFNFGISRDGADGSESVNLDLSGEEIFTGTDLPTAFTYQSAVGGSGFLLIQTTGVNLNASFSITCASTDPSVCVIPGSDGGDTAVPEPATWLSLALGFGALGGRLRRQRKQILRKA